MAVTTTYGLLASSGAVGALDSEADIIALPDGTVAYAATDAGATAGFAGLANFSGVTGVDPSLALLTNGNVVIAGESGGTIVYRIVNQSGATVVVTTSVADSGSSNPDVAALTGGGFVIVSQDAFVAPDNDIDVRVYDNNGVNTQTFSVDGTTADDRDAQVAALGNGNYVVAWTRTIGAETEIWFAIYDTAGGMVAAPQLHDTTGTINRNLGLCATSTGFALVYEDNGWAGGADVEVTLSRHSVTGAFLGFTNITNNATNDERPQVAQLANGLLAVSYGVNTNADTDIVVALVNQANGAVLASQVVSGGLAQNHDVTNNALAAFGGASVRALSTDATTLEVRQDTLLVTRTSTSDGAGDTIIGDDALDTMNGNGGADNLQGQGGDDVLNGGAGDDILNGGGGIDVMQGGANDDTYFVNVTGDQITEFVGEGIDTVFSTATSYTLSANVENLTLTGSAIAGFGNDQNNVITGNATSNTINGGIGADTMIGGGGDDTYTVDNPNDVVVETAGGGIDRINSSVDISLADGAEVEEVALLGFANLNISGNLQTNYLLGNGGDNILQGWGGADSLTGADGDDTLDGGVGADTMAGGLGNDTYYRDENGDSVFEAAGEGVDHVISATNYSLSGDTLENLTLTGTALFATGNGLVNILTGNAMDNQISGLGGADTLYGAGGADELDGGAGSDILVGGLGNDVYYIDSTGDQIIELADEGDQDRIVTSVNYSLFGDTIEHLAMSGVDNLDGVGNGLGNFMLGNAGNNTLAGLGGADILDGQFGADQMIGGDGDDTYYIDNVADSVVEFAGEGSDGVYATVSFSLVGLEVEFAVLEGGMDLDLTGNDKANYLHGNQGANVLIGGLGADGMTGHEGDDTYYVDNVGDTVTEFLNEGTDQIFSTVGVNLTSGYVEHATLLGAANVDLTGNVLSNVLTGNDGNNVLVGGGGNDTLSGLDGVDTADYRNAAGGVSVSLATGLATDDGDGGADTLSGIENLIGSGFGDVLVGDGGANVLYGEAGADSLTGGDGNDVLRGGAGIDQLNGGLGIDLADYSTAAGGVTANLTLASASNDGDGGTDSLSGIENLTGSAFGDTLTGSGANNILIGGLGADNLSGLNGDDLFIAGAGVDLYDGGGGIDTVDYSSAAAGVTARLDSMKATNDGDGGTDTFVGIESLIGSAFNDLLISGTLGDTLKGGLGADTLLGFGGNDVLWGGSGAANTLQGGLGNDTYVLEAGDSVVELVGEGTDTVDVRIAVYNLANNVENLTFGGIGNFTGSGNALANTITGGAGDDVLRGRGGVDVIKGGSGGMDTADYSLAAAGVHARLDTMSAINDGDGATDTFVGIDAIVGSAFVDLLVGGTLGDRLSGGLGADTLLGFGGNDILSGGQGDANQLQGGLGDDLYILDAYDTVVETAGQGIDTIEAHVGAHNMGANVENMYYVGNNKFFGTGNAIDNVIAGGVGNDILKGMGGNDTLAGGAGLDEVQFRGTKAQYTVTAEGAGYRVVDSIGGRDGSTLVDSIETLRFLTGNTTTALSYPPPGPAPLEPDAKAGGLDAQVLPSLFDDGDVFVLPTVADDQPLVLPGVLAFKFDGEPLILPGLDAAVRSPGFEARLALATDWMLTLDETGGLFGDHGHRGHDWI